MEDLQIGRTRYRVPSTWNELTRAQLLGVMGVLYGPETKLPARLRLLSVLSGAPLAELLTLPEIVVVQLYPLTDFVASEEHRLTEQLLPEVKVGRTRFVGPRSSFRNLLFGEFIFADTYFRAWATHRSAEALDLFLATLYRPAVPGLGPGDPRWRGDRREEFNEHRTEYLAQRLAHLPDAQKLAITTWYRGCRTQLELEFPEVFDGPDEVRQGKPGDWGQVLRKLSGGAFGPLEQTARQHTRTLLAEMQDRARHYTSLKK
ncbi:hypothetical protein J0X19_22470 [Hymenobacter sp. BT186]|uniref:Uncharacterized protein n=1 Tax=Hymenobacter telluris TaxID=2816474 RepID=A0A939F3K0_9BACT|nr:hypothetical protein [Hymenobacter telluris]MBO0360743.1 hypothetical protein [Hymenobacter telluris]MBW3376771.1 hypothetical protein [Hymenobacter norwichensis]